MRRSGKIWVLKRDGTVERFERQKLRSCLLRVIPASAGKVFWADALSVAVGCYILRRRLRCVSSAAILEMALAALRAVALGESAARLERWHSARLSMRNALTMHHDRHTATDWSKEWLVQQVQSRWSMGRAAARIIAGHVERHLMGSQDRHVTRPAVMGMLESIMAEYGFSAPPEPAMTLPPA